MGQGKRRRGAFITNHPFCYFCETAPTETIEHMPPRSAFSVGLHPEGYEFPACQRCNNRQSGLEQVVALYIHAFDFHPDHYDEAQLAKLSFGVHNNHIAMMPRIGLSTRSKRTYLRDNNIRLPPGQSVSDFPLALVPKEAQQAFLHFGRKLTCALYYRVTARPMSLDHAIRCVWQQMVAPATTEHLDRFLDILTHVEMGTRRNVDIGERFQWLWRYDEQKDIFVYVAAFGNSILFTGAAGPAGDAPKDSGWISHRMDLVSAEMEAAANAVLEAGEEPSDET